MSSASRQPPHPPRFVPPGFESYEQWHAQMEAQDAAQRQRAEHAGLLADTILTCCGVGSVLEVGCGDGALLRALSLRGCGVRGVDASAPTVEEAARWRFPRVEVGDVRSLSEGEGEVDTVVAIDVLHHLEEHEVAGAIATLARAARKSVFLRVSTLPVEEKPKHKTSRPREWWQQKCFDAGLRTHARAMLAADYGHLDSQIESVTLVLEKLGASAAREWPLSRLAEEKQLHMDMLREPGRRADAHVARYMIAAQLVRPGDTVLDVACGLGYGAHVLAQNSRAAKVVGVDVDAGSVEYAATAYGGRAEFRVGDAQDLSAIADASVDLVVSFETLEHLPDPERAVREFARVLTPGGRLIASVPNDWTDETGKDPNPHHLHVYTWDVLSEQVRGAGLLFERVQAQTAGGGMKHPHAARTVREVRASELGFVQEDHVPAEWWLVTAMKDPLGASGSHYRESVFPVGGAFAGNVTAFARDYDNPWLVRSMVSIGQRATGSLLFSIAARAVNECRPGSPDMGAALCVLGYHFLESPQCSPKGVAETRDRVRAFDAAADASPHAQRWRCSCWFVVGRLLMSIGDMEGARESFERCVGVDVLSFSPLLATKTVEARWWLGVLAARGGDLAQARVHWRSGMEEARRAAAADWRDVIGDPERPLAFGLPELSQVLDQAARCAWAIGMGDGWLHEPGLAWAASAVNAGAARAAASREASALRGAWDGQQRAIGELVRTRDSLWEESQRIAGALSHTKEEAERLREAWRGHEARVQTLEVEKVRMWEEQQASIAAMEAEQRRRVQDVADERDRLFSEAQRIAALWEQLRAHNQELQRGLDSERSLREQAERARDANWDEQVRITRQWEKLRDDNERLLAEVRALQSSVNEAAVATDRLRGELVGSESDRGRLSRELADLRGQLIKYRAGLRYRVLRGLRIVYGVPE